MQKTRARLVLASQHALAAAVVGAVAASAVGVVNLELAAPQTGPPAADSLVSTSPVRPTVHTVPLDQATTSSDSRLGTQSRRRAADPQEIRLVSDPEPVSGYATVGVTWDAEGTPEQGAVAVEVRSRTEEGWSPWEPVPQDLEHAPDPGSPEASPGRLRAGTEPVVLGAVDRVQARATTEAGQALPELALAVVDPGEDTELDAARPALEPGAQDDSAAQTTAPEADLDAFAVNGDNSDKGAEPGLTLAAARAAKPKIFSRAQWGADERLRHAGSLRYGDIQTGFVHHTVNANDYTEAQVPSIIRGIYAYHTQSRGWSDIGYNFLVDRFGKIWEGRYGGIDKPVVGAHTLGYNEVSFAMSAIGNFETVRPPQAVLDAYGRLMAWKLSLHDVAADDMSVAVKGRTFRAINGHRDAGSTACPGRYLYARLPDIRTLAAELQRAGGSGGAAPAGPRPPEHPTTALRLQLSGTPWPDLVVRDPDTQHLIVVRTAGQLGFGTPFRAGGGWGTSDLVTEAGDLTGDGITDLVSREAGSGMTTVHAGRLDGTAVAVGSFRRFSALDQLTGVGDLDEDGRDDLVGRHGRNAKLLFFPGHGDGTFGRKRVLSADWGRFDLTAGVDDLDGDGNVDLVARQGQRLYLVPGTGRGIGEPRVLGRRNWDAFDVVTGRGDASRDGHPDIVVRHRASGKTYVYPGDGAGGLGPRLGGWSRFASMQTLTLAGQLAGSARPDLATVNPRGALRVFPHTDRRNLGAVVDTGTVASGIDLLLNVGDWDGDGRGDVMTRNATTGVLSLHRGRAHNRLADPVVVRKRFGGISALAPAGDVTGDGYPDLVGTGAQGANRVYPSNGRTGISRSLVLRPSNPGPDRVGVGFWDADRTPDTAVRRSNGTLWVRSSDHDGLSRIADRLRRYDWLLGLGDLDGDGRADLAARASSTGRLYLLPGTPAGFGARRLIAPGFDRYDLGG